MNQRLSKSLQGPRTETGDEDDARWRHAIDASSLGVWDWNLRSGDVFYSHHWKAMLGYDDGDVGRSVEDWHERVHPEDRPAFDAALRAHLDGGAGEFVSEHRMRCKDGSDKWVLDKGCVTERNADGQPARIVGTQKDISERKLDELRLAAQEQRFRLTFSEAPIGMALAATDGRWLEVNDFLCEIVGRSREELLAGHMQDLSHPDDVEADLDSLQRMQEGGQSHTRMTKLLRHRDGHLLHTQVDISLARDAAGAPAYFVVQVQDISERLRLHQELHGEKTRLEVTLASITDAVVIADVDGAIEFANPVAQRLLRLPSSGGVGRPFSEVADLREEDSDHPIQLLHAGSRQKVSFIQGSARLVRTNVPPLVVEYALSPLKDDYGALMGYAVTLHDVTEARALTRAFEHQATHDALTGLPNRIGFERQVENRRFHASRHHEDWCLLYLDLDRFKAVNDTAGHAVGDELLRALTNRIRSALRVTDTFARLGGDEFGIILTDCAIPDAERIASKLIDVVDTYRFRRDGAEFQIGLSIGIAGGSATASVADLLRMADTACYVAKRTGRNRACTYNDSVIEGVAASAEFDALHELQRAFDHDQLRVFGQKIVNTRTGEAVGVELLLRTALADGSAGLPDRFLRAAERNDLVTRIDGWMLQHAVDLIAGERTLPQNWFVTVNVSGQSMSDPRFHRVISELIDGNRILRDRICFEITESVAPSNWTTTRQGIDLLRSHGLRVIVDDFGSGFTSFEYLRDLHVDGLKVSGEFTRNLPGDAINDTVVTLVASLARRLEIFAIAEGVEDANACALIVDKGIDMAQGFYFHRPEPIEHLLLRR